MCSEYYRQGGGYSLRRGLGRICYLCHNSALGRGRLRQERMVGEQRAGVAIRASTKQEQVKLE